jgi:hypothetical protein
MNTLGLGEVIVVRMNQIGEYGHLENARWHHVRLIPGHIRVVSGDGRLGGRVFIAARRFV